MKQKEPMLTPNRRALMLRVIDDRPELPPIIYLFLQLRRCDDVLRWCIAHQLTGLRFLQWFHVEGKTPFHAMQIILERLNREKNRPILAHRDWLTTR